MQLSSEDIAEFQAIWKEEFGEDIEAGAAMLTGGRLLALAEVIAKQRLSALDLARAKTRKLMEVGVAIAGQCRVHVLVVSAHRYCSLYAEVW